MRQVRLQQEVSIPVGWLIIGMVTFFALIANVSGQTALRVKTVGFTVSDMDKAIDFYTRILPFEKISDVEVFGSEIEHLSGVFGARVRVVRLKLGDEVLELTDYLTHQGRPIPVDSRSNDRWFQHVAIIVADMDRAYAHLRSHMVRHASTAPQTLPEYITAAAGIRAFYFRDFDNHVLEILSFPPGKGSTKWHELAKSGKLFLGIDHTAIVVGDTEKSLEFYRDALGLRVAGESINYGPEQERLNNVFGARLRITGLQTRDAGVAVEFLEYMAPIDGRPFPRDTRSSDIWHWETTFAANDPEKFISSFRPDLVSSSSIFFSAPVLGFRRAAMVRDPDGHAIRLAE